MKKIKAEVVKAYLEFSKLLILATSWFIGPNKNLIINAKS